MKTNKSRIAIFMIAIFIIVLAGCSNSAVKFTPYEDTISKFKVNYPEGWKTKEKHLGPVKTVMFSAPDQVSGFAVVINNKPAINEFGDEALEFVKDEIKRKNMTIISTEKSEIAKTPAYKLVVTRKIQNIDTNEIWFITIKNNYLYIVTMMSDKTKFDSFTHIFGEVTKSFEITSQ